MVLSPTKVMIASTGLHGRLVLDERLPRRRHCWVALSLGLGPQRRRTFSSTRPTFATRSGFFRQIGSSANLQASLRFNGLHFDPCATNLRLRSTSNGLGRPRNLPSKGCLPRKSTRSSTAPGEISSSFPRPDSNARNHCSSLVRDPLLIQHGNVPYRNGSIFSDKWSLLTV
ncbi:hypothetical protein FA13DRAFT_876269 [Coprinellus micaceus]|uniref:Uncharacterized protein n=1 Tax=Coprinellus micaceus TaxID=71717 RepID=A0A4Y7T0E3_COPMI|nr:hypothetical protein FA13DRAFT_876269 [Coprinellus micaceus]